MSNVVLRRGRHATIPHADKTSVSPFRSALRSTHVVAIWCFEKRRTRQHGSDASCLFVSKGGAGHIDHLFVFFLAGGRVRNHRFIWNDFREFGDTVAERIVCVPICLNGGKKQSRIISGTLGF
jgi:hypothetical protein